MVSGMAAGLIDLFMDQPSTSVGLFEESGIRQQLAVKDLLKTDAIHVTD